MNHHGHVSPEAGKRGNANVQIESTIVIAATNRCRRSGRRREDRREAVEEVREEDEQLDRDPLRNVLEQAVRMVGTRRPIETISPSAETQRQPPGGVIAATAPLPNRDERRG